MSHRKEKRKSKNKVIDYIIVLSIILALGGFFMMIIKEIYIEKNNHIKEVTYQEYVNKIARDEYTIVLLASPNCSHCMQYKPFVNSVAKEYNLEIYYVNVDGISQNEYTVIHDSVSSLKSQFDSEGYPSIPTPTTVIYKNGVEVSSELGNIRDTGLKRFLEKNGVIK